MRSNLLQQFKVIDQALLFIFVIWVGKHYNANEFCFSETESSWASREDEDEVNQEFLAMFLQVQKSLIATELNQWKAHFSFLVVLVILVLKQLYSEVICNVVQRKVWAKLLDK